MFFRKIETERSLWIYFGAILLMTAAIVVAITSYLANIYTNTVKTQTLQAFMISNQKDAAEIENFLDRGEAVLNMASHLVSAVVEQGASPSQIDSLLIKGTIEDRSFGTLYGLIQGNLFGKSIENEGNYPSRWPWFQGAMLAQGKIAFVPTYAKHKEKVISLSQRLSDKKSVLAIDLNLKSLRECISPWRYANTWMVMDVSGFVVAHSNEANQGLYYLSSDFWRKDEESLAKGILIANGKPFPLTYGNGKYQVFTSKVKDKWYMVRLVDEDSMWHDMKLSMTKGIASIILLYALFAILVSMCLKQRLIALRMSRAKSGFLTNMSREIRTSITGILGMDSIAMKEARDDSLKDYLKNIQNAGQSILALVNDVLDVCKIESGKMSIVSMEYDVFSVIADCYNANIHKASVKKLRFTVECNPDIPMSLWGDENRIRQIINNLLSNAIKFTEVGEISLTVSFENLPPVGSLNSDDYIVLLITIKDTGTGIKNDELESIFNKFATPNLDEPTEGVGIGLSLTKELVEKSGGQIEVSSRLGDGSTFTVRIPQLVLNVEPMGDFAMKLNTLNRKNMENVGIFLAPDARVLIVDDVEMNLKVLRGFLRRFKIQVDVAVSGMQCLKLAQAKHYDLIFLDCVMPVMDGIETYRKMKSLENFVNKNTPVIALTSEGATEGSESFLSVGFADYLTKPIKERDLQRALKWYLPKQLVLSGEDIVNQSESGAFKAAIDHAAMELKRSSNGEIELQTVTALTPYEKLAPFKEWLDIKVGLDYCADDSDIYLEMLQEYINSPLHRYIENCFKTSDWENYCFYIHVLSDSSSAIGAISMSERFQNLENACREARMNVVHETHGLVMALHADLINNIQKVLEG